MFTRTRLALAALTLAIVVPVIAADSPAAPVPFDNPKAKIPPLAKQNRISGGESFPPLPLPATPIRRTEHKREPAPPALVGKVDLSFIDTSNGGQKITAYPSITLDIENLMNWTNAQLKLKYRYVETDLSKFSFEPTELPVLYLTGWTPLPQFTEKTKDNLRSYLLAGGTMIVHANCGRPEFIDSFRKLQAELFPDRPMAWLPEDHPIYHCLNDITKMRVREGTDPWKETKPLMQAMYIGCRAAIIFSPVDISWGWDADKNPIPGGILYDQQDSLKLGANMLTYVLANYEYGRAFQMQKIYQQADMATRDQLVIAQIVHNGDWDPTPHGLPNLLKFIDTNSTLNVQFKRVTVDLENDDALKHPILYLTGLRNFALDDNQQKRLGNYLNAGGFLLVDDAMGGQQFDSAVRPLLEKITGKKFEILKPDHPLFNNVFNERNVTYSQAVESTEPNLKQPIVEAIIKDGVPVVIYTRLSLSNGWEGLPNPYARAYSDDDALKLGTNILVYTMTR